MALNLDTDEYEHEGETMLAIEHPDNFDWWLSMDAAHIMEIRQ